MSARFADFPGPIGLSKRSRAFWPPKFYEEPKAETKKREIL
jgi:hypothetical protein